MAQLIWTESALSDLNEIAEYIALENPTAASLLVQQVFSAVERLAQHPASGKFPIELEGRR
jgi:toxin ParE1/3/4